MSTQELLPSSQERQVARYTTPADLLSMAVDKGADLDRLEKLMDLQLKWEANEARKAYVVAMTEFKANPPEIFKTKEVSFSGTNYMHATLGGVTTAITEELAKHGLSHRWDVQQKDGEIIVNCIVTHSMGHFETTTLRARPDDSGKKNAIQQVASSVTYLQRYTLLAATGLASKDMEDDDGASSAKPKDTLTDEQVATMEAAIKEVGADRTAFLKFAKVADVADIPQRNFDVLMATINKKKQAPAA